MAPSWTRSREQVIGFRRIVTYMPSRLHAALTRSFFILIGIFSLQRRGERRATINEEVGGVYGVGLL